MKCKKTLACVLSVALLGSAMFDMAGNNERSLFDNEKVSAVCLVPYGLLINMTNSSFIIKEGSSITVDLLKEHGLMIDEIVGTYHDMQPDPLYGQLTKTNTSQSIPVEDCTYVIPEKITEGENKITVSYCPSNIDKSFTVTDSFTINVSFLNSAAPVVTQPDVTQPQVTSVPDDAPAVTEPETTPPREYHGNVTFDLTDSIAQPGEVTYLDINIGENTGFCTVLLNLEFDDSIFDIVSISTTSDFTGDEYLLKYSIAKKAMIFMNSCRDNMETPNTNVIRVALAVKEDAPEGDYTVSLTSDPAKGGVAGILPDRSIGFIGLTTLPGTVTVSKTLTPKTNVSSLSLGRVYAEIEGKETVNKTGDTTGDGKINALDTIKMIRYFTGTEQSISNADIDENGKVNVADLIKLKNYITLG